MSTPTLSSRAGEIVTRRYVVPVAVAIVVALALGSASGKAPLGIIVQGAIFGTGTGLLGVGLVLIYRSTRIVNFAYGAMGGLPATVGVSLYLGRGWSWPATIAVSVLVGALVGMIVELLVIRRFANSSRLVLTVATIGLAQVLGGISLLVPGWLGNLSQGAFQTPLNNVNVTVDPVVVTGNDFLLLASVPVVLALLSWFLLRTDAGIAVRGVADNRERAQLLGIPVALLGTLVWTIAGAVAALTVLLAAPSKGLIIDAAAGPELLLPALAAAVAAGMENLKVAFIVGVGLGVVDQLVQWNVNKTSLTSVVFFLVVLVVLLVKRRSAGRANTGGEWNSAGRIHVPDEIRRLPQVRIARAAGIAAVLSIAVTLPLVASASQINLLTIAVISGILVVSLVMLTGWSGSVSLGQFAIAGVGGLVAANLLSRFHMDLFLALIIAALVGGLIALVLGLPGLRLDGLFLAVTTLAFAVVMDTFVLNPVNFGDAIPDSVDRPMLWQRFSLDSGRVLYYLCLGALVLTIILVSGIRRARAGRVLLASRDNDRAAAAAGVATTRSRLGAFVATGMIAGMAGGLQVVLLGGMHIHDFKPADSLLLFSMAVIGGIESIGGALVGVGFVQMANYLFPEYQLVITGTGLLVILMVMPRGLSQVMERVGARIQLLLARSAIEAKVVDDPGFLVVPNGRPIITSPRRPTVDLTSEPATLDLGNGNGHRPVLLDCRGVTASYGQMQVLFGIDLTVREGEIVALLGTNGAGKSTFLNCVTGLMRPDSGSITIAGDDMTSRSPEQIARRGVALMPGGRGLFPSLTVEENLRLATWMLRKQAGAATIEKDNALALMPVLSERLELRAGMLSGGEQQMLSMAMALSTRPQILCIDELSIGLAPTVVSMLVEQVKKIRDAGTTVVLVEQSVSVALMLAERAEFIEKGEVRFAGRTQDLLDQPDVLKSVFVGDVDAVTASPTATAPAARVASSQGNGRALVGGSTLECRELTKRYGGITAVNSVSLTFEPGSIVGIIGHNGAGKTTLFDLLTGFLRPDGGRILLGGIDITDRPPHRRSVLGLGRSFQEARLYPGLTVRETMAVGLDQHIACHDPVAAALSLPASLTSEAAAWKRADEIIEMLGLGDEHDRLTSELSTGTRRIVELACIIAQEPQVVLLDEPGGGVAQRDTENLIPLLKQVQAASGCAMVVIDHNMNLITGVCEELVAMELGAVITRGTPADVLSHPEVVASYLGTEEGLPAAAHVAPSDPAPRAGAFAPSAPSGPS